MTLVENMPGFILVSNSGKKISLEHTYHACPKCKNENSVQLTRSEKSFIFLNRVITENSSVRYECSQCKWKNQTLPLQQPSEPFDRQLSHKEIFLSPSLSI
ncbi:hypothetical protein BY458DRAFT_505965 [Sporodiniella umbellata]|nr:hypothetical protein BY458DRAFT_505965 [Sporodiniella umbellata]